MTQKNLLAKAADCKSVLIGFSTAPNLKTAKKIAEILVKENLAKCVQIGGEIESYYVWENKFCKSKEIPITIKFPEIKSEILYARFKDLHPYDCPQWLCLSPKAASKAYAKWVLAD